MGTCLNVSVLMPGRPRNTLELRKAQALSVSGLLPASRLLQVPAKPAQHLGNSSWIGGPVVAGRFWLRRNFYQGRNQRRQRRCDYCPRASAAGGGAKIFVVGQFPKPVHMREACTV